MTKEYTSESIQVLSPLEHIQRRNNDFNTTSKRKLKKNKKSL